MEYTGISPDLLVEAKLNPKISKIEVLPTKRIQIQIEDYLEYGITFEYDTETQNSYVKLKNAPEEEAIRISSEIEGCGFSTFIFNDRSITRIYVADAGEAITHG